MHELRLKAGPIGNLTDARYFAAQGVDWVSFCFDPLSPDYRSPEEALSIKNWLYGPKCVGEFRNQDAENVMGIAEFVGLDALELDLAVLPLPPELQHLPIFLRVSGTESDTELSALPPLTHALLLDPSGLEEPSKTLIRLEHFAPVWLSGIGNVGQAAPLLERSKPAGLCLSGGEELETGLKLFDELDELFLFLESRTQSS